MQDESSTTRLLLKAIPNASREEIAGRHGTRWKVKVRAPPEDGRANTAILELLSQVLHINKRALRLVRGEAAREKEILVSGLSPEETDRRLSQATRR